MISVIVPIYNTDKYLSRCIESILNQTYKNIELILVNDGSTDKCDEICENYLKKDNRIVYYKLENGGQGRARNYALDRCHGDWISFIDSDDWIEKDMYTEMIGMAISNDCDIAVCGWYRNHGFFQKSQQSLNQYKTFDNEETMKEYLKSTIISASMCNKIYKSYIWDNIRFPETRAKEDSAIMYKVLSKSKKTVHIGKPKYIQYVRPGSTERRGFSEDKIYIIKESDKMKSYIQDEYPNLYYLVELRPAKYCINLMQEIISSFKLKKYKSIYNNLFDTLVKEMNKEYSNEVKKSKDYIYINDIMSNQKKFIIKSYIVGIKDKLIDIVKFVFKF